MAHLGAGRHLFVVFETGRGVAVIEKNPGRAGQRPGERVHQRFAPAECTVVAAEG